LPPFPSHKVLTLILLLLYDLLTGAPSRDFMEVQIVDSSYQTRTELPISRTVATTKMPKFTNGAYEVMHFVYGSCDENSLAALRVYQY
jgi:hypothetical protein